MTEVESRESIVDQEHLKLLSIGYLVSAGWSAFFSLFGVFYALMGLFMSSFFSHMPVGQLPPGRAEPPPPELFGWIFGLFAWACSRS